MYFPNSRRVSGLAGSLHDLTYAVDTPFSVGGDKTQTGVDEVPHLEVLAEQELYFGSDCGSRILVIRSHRDHLAREFGLGNSSLLGEQLK